jgi:exopolysaccharide biosynthesis polyprenyl glycosylphosphotransferase
MRMAPVDTRSQDRRFWLSRSLMALDAAIGGLCLVLCLTGGMGLPRPASILHQTIQVARLLQIGGLLAIWHFSFAAVGLYHSRRLSSRLDELVDVVKAVTLAVLAVFLLDHALGVNQFPARVAWLFWAIAVVACAISRMALRFLLQQLRLHGRNLRHLLIVGTNTRALDLASKINSRPWLGYRLLGFVDDPDEVREEFVSSRQSLLCGLTGFGPYLATHVVDEVIICLPLRSYYREAARLAQLCHEQGIIVRVSSDLFDLGLGYARADHLEGERLVTISSGGMEGWPALTKNALDRGLSGVALILLSPVLAATAIAIRLTSPGPVLYVQERIGFRKRRFRLLKFRTMVADADVRQHELESSNEVCGPVFKIRNDPRVTPVGRFLRKHSIDELPQLVNVLMGDMSLVGPRPLPARDCEGFTTDWHRRRFSVRPGLSCLWQISGRSMIGFEDWMRLDMQYIDQWSLWLDLKIMVKTLGAVLKGAGAW